MNEYRPREDYRAFNRPPRRLNWLAVFLFLSGLAIGTLMPGTRAEHVAEQPVQKPVVAEAQTLPAPDPSSAINYDRIVSATAKKAMPAVVTIHVSSTVVVRYRDPFFDLFYGPQRRNISGMGSGVIIDPDGLIITNNHVATVEGRAGEIDVFLTDGRHFKAKVVRDFPDQDLALLSIDGKNLPYLEFGQSGTVEPGQTVLAIGNPFGDKLSGGLSYSEPTVTRGIISATSRNLTIPLSSGGERYLRNMLQTDASINPGNSGGALIDLNGKLIGINTVIMSNDSQVSVGIGFAIPSDRVKLILDSFRNRDARGAWYTGISVQDITPDIAREIGYKGEGGSVITKVEDGSPGEKSGLKPGDVIVRVNGFAVRTKDELSSMFRGSVPGETFRLTVVRGGKTSEFTLRLGSK